MNKAKGFRRILPVLIALVFITAFAPLVSANSAEPPLLTVICLDAPDDLKLTMLYTQNGEERSEELERFSMPWGTYFDSFNYSYYDLLNNDETFSGFTFLAESSEKSFTAVLGLPDSYGVYTLHYEEETLMYGEEPFSTGRKWLLVALRVSVTFLTEGLVFLAFGYRKRRSWLIFAITNLITQIALNAFIITALTSRLENYSAMLYLMCEPIIFVTEIAVFAVGLKEHKLWRGAVCALTANFVSLFAGGLLIVMLPF